ncbi:MAG: EH signature domain-containing protein [Acidobacteriota bacterium]
MPTCPDQYLRAWKAFSRGDPVELGNRAVRYLAWEPDVVLDPRFHRYLRDAKVDLGARSLQGLVRACHLRWPEFVKSEAMQEFAARRLRKYRGTNRILTRWKESIKVILHVDGPEALAARMLEGLRTPQMTASEWNVDANSDYFGSAMRALLKKARTQWRGQAKVAEFVCQHVLAWEGWTMDQLKKEVSDSILHPDATDKIVNDLLKAFVLRHPKLGDPTYPANRTNWLGVHPEALRRLVEWLSKANITFFFEHVFAKGEDRHLRKRFWLRYVSHVVRSRALLCPSDLARLRNHIRQIGREMGNFGMIRGYNRACPKSS